jgi:hypothetical protein
LKQCERDSEREREINTRAALASTPPNACITSEDGMRYPKPFFVSTSLRYPRFTTATDTRGIAASATADAVIADGSTPARTLDGSADTT